MEVDGIHREYTVSVIAKHLHTGLSGYEGRSIVLRLVSEEWTPGRPYWIDRTLNGSPMTLDVTEREYDHIKVGDELRITVSQLILLSDLR